MLFEPSAKKAEKETFRRRSFMAGKQPSQQRDSVV